MSAFEAATSWNRGIPFKIFKSLIKLYFYCFIFYFFPLYIYIFIKGKTFVNARENICRPLRQLGPETGESLAKNSNN